MYLNNSGLVFVTGASGQLGRKLVATLSAKGYNVRAHFRSPEKAHQWCPPNVEAVFGDLKEAAWLGAAFKGCQTVIHGAAKVSLRPGPDSEMESVNVAGTGAVIDSCLANNVKRLIYISSIVTVGASKDGNPATEDIEFNLGHINLPYIHTKRAAESMVLSANSPRLQTIVLNPAIMISRPDRIVTAGDFRKIPRFVPAYFDFGLNLVETDDVIYAIVAAINKGRPGQRYLLTGDNIAAPKAILLAEKLMKIKPPFLKVPRWLLFPVAWIVELRARLRGKRPSFHRGLARLAYYNFFYSSDKAKIELGFDPKPIEETIVRIIDVLKQHRPNSSKRNSQPFGR